jgi:hypothetical protein
MSLACASERIPDSVVRWVHRVLDLEPALAPAGTMGAIEALRDNALGNGSRTNLCTKIVLF